MAPEHPPEPTAREWRRHDLGNRIAILRMRTQLLQRLARTQDGDGWQRMADGLAAIDADLTALLADHDHHEAD